MSEPLENYEDIVPTDPPPCGTRCTGSPPPTEKSKRFEDWELVVATGLVAVLVFAFIAVFVFAITQFLMGDPVVLMFLSILIAMPIAIFALSKTPHK